MKTKISVQITTPVLPNWDAVEKITERIKKELGEFEVSVKFAKEYDIFDVLVLDQAKNEQVNSRSIVMIALFSELYGND